MKSHRDLVTWQKAWSSACRIHRHGDARWSAKRSAVWDQLRRASLSVPLNIAEGYAYGMGKRCRYHFNIAYGSAVETAELLMFLGELGDGEVGSLIEGAHEVERLSLRLWRKTRV